MLNKFLNNNKATFYFLFRVIVGLLFMIHGATKFGWIGGGSSVELVSLMGLAAIIEFFGGLLIVLGAYTVFAAVLGGLEMIYVYLTVHIPQGFNPLVNGGELALLFLAAFLVLATVGAGKLWSYDNRSKRR